MPARRQPLVGQVGAARETNLLAGGVDRAHLVAHHLHAVAAQRVVAARDLAHAGVAAEHQVRDRARDERGFALDQHHVDRGVPQADVLRRGGAAEAAADHHHACLGGLGGRAAGERDRAGELEEVASFHAHLFCAAYQPDGFDLRVAVALGDLVHHGRGALAIAERAHLGRDVVARQAGERNERRWAPACPACRGRWRSPRQGCAHWRPARVLPAPGRGADESDGPDHGISPRQKSIPRDPEKAKAAERRARRGQATAAGSSSNLSLIFSSSPMSMVTLPPCCRRPNSSSSASARRIVSWIRRAIGGRPSAVEALARGAA